MLTYLEYFFLLFDTETIKLTSVADIYPLVFRCCVSSRKIFIN